MRAWMAIALFAMPCAASERSDVLFVAQELVGVMEQGINDGPEVKKILASVGLETGNPWCAAFNYYVFSMAGLADRVPRSGWSPDWVRGGVRTSKTPEASVFGVYFQSLGRVAHTGIIESCDGVFATTIEGNTNAGGGRGAGGGDGVYRRKRSMRTIICKDWL